jgi:serine/threonine protein kinase
MIKHKFHKSGYDSRVDVWAVGCMLYQMLFGKPPFFDEVIENIIPRILVGSYRLKGMISEPALSLIQSCLIADPDYRISVHDLLNHKFFTQP